MDARFLAPRAEDPGERHARFQAPHSDRLDKLVAAGVAGLTRSAAHKLIDAGQVQVNGQPRGAGDVVRPGDWIDVRSPAPVSAELRAEAIDLDILFEDADVLVINKPAGMVVHPGAGVASGTVANAVLSHAPESIEAGDDPSRPGIVHRLDKETSGALLVAKTDPALRALQAQFKSRTIDKTYLAVCVGEVMPASGLIDRPIGRDPSHRQRIAIVSVERPAQNDFTVTRRWTVADANVVARAFGAAPERKAPIAPMRYALLRAHPRTGRTHQVRVHFASLGFPIVGDETYGATRRDPLSKALAPRHLLHASELRFNLPSTGAELRVEAPLPEDFRRVLESLEP